MIEIYRDAQKISNHPNHALYDIVKRIDSVVQQCADRAYNLNVLNTDNPKQRNWYEKLNCYLSGYQTIFMPAFYGYAVEEMVNITIQPHCVNWINGYKIRLQVTHGSTRPDIVIINRKGTELVWLDITSQGSAGHIWTKDGSGWYTVPFVAELLYDSFNPELIRDSDESGIGIRAGALNTSRIASIKNRNLIEHMLKCMNVGLLKLSEEDRISKSTVAAAFEAAFEYALPLYRKHPAIKSMLIKYLEIRPEADFARYLLKNYYKKDRQDVSMALNFISDSYSNSREKDIYVYYDDSDDILA